MLASSESDVPEEVGMIMGRPVQGSMKTPVSWPHYLAASLLVAVFLMLGNHTPGSLHNGLHWLMLTALLVMILLGCRLSFRVMARLWQGMTLTTVVLVLYQWLGQQLLSPLGLLLPLLLVMVLPWRWLWAGVLGLVGVLLLALMRGAESGLGWSYVGAYGLSSWMALLLAFKVQMMDDAVSEANSDYPLSGVYNARRLEVDLGREISRSERSGSTLVVMVLSALDFSEVSDTRAVLKADYLQALCSVVPPHCAVYRWNAATLVVLMPACSVDDVVLLNADMSDVMGLPLSGIHGVPLFYAPSSGPASMKQGLETRITMTMDVIRRLAQ